MTGNAEKFDRINATPAYQLVAEAIEREIVAGRIRPGEPIGTEAELVKQFGVNRSTVREGIRLLEQGGLIRRNSSRRLFASLPRYNRLATRISRALILHEVTFRELWETVTVLEIAAMEQAVLHATPEEVVELADNLARSERVAADPTALSELEVEFHAMIARASRNRVLQLAREPGSLLIFPTTEIIFRKIEEAAPRLLEAHRLMVEALGRRDKEAGRLWMRRHVNDWRKGFERAGNDLDQPVDRVYMQHLMLPGGSR